MDMGMLEPALGCLASISQGWSWDRKALPLVYCCEVGKVPGSALPSK